MDLRLPKTSIVIGISGVSCSGKTTAAESLGRSLCLPVRHCGRIAQARQRAGATITNQMESHRLIDDETRLLAAEPGGGLVVEGCFLEYVLRQIPGVFLVRLECNQQVRLTRAKSKGIDLLSRNEADQVLVSSAYDEGERRDPNVRLDTTDSTPAEVEADIIAAFTAHWKAET